MLGAALMQAVEQIEILKKLLFDHFASLRAMTQKLEAIRGGGGSIKVGTTGTISALMSREFEYAKSASISASTNHAAPTRLKPGISADEASSSSGMGSSRNHKDPENSRRKHGTPQIPMLKAYDNDNTSVDGTPIRKKPVKKGHCMVEIVDIKCRIPITHRLKKVSFSKLSDNTNV